LCNWEHTAAAAEHTLDTPHTVLHLHVWAVFIGRRHIIAFSQTAGVQYAQGRRVGLTVNFVRSHVFTASFAGHFSFVDSWSPAASDWRRAALMTQSFLRRSRRVCKFPVCTHTCFLSGAPLFHIYTWSSSITHYIHTHIHSALTGGCIRVVLQLTYNRLNHNKSVINVVGVVCKLYPFWADRNEYKWISTRFMTCKAPLDPSSFPPPARSPTLMCMMIGVQWVQIVHTHTHTLVGGQ
jgi:hypothetical protein